MVGTLVGAGGGFLLVPILLFLYPSYTPSQVAAMSLWVVMANAASGSIAYARQRRIDYRSGFVFALAALPGAIGGALVVNLLPRRTFAGIFAGALGSVAIYLLLRRAPRHIREPVAGWGVASRRIRDSHGVTFRYSYRIWQGLLISLAVGFVSSLLGIGGGVIHVPLLAIVLRFPMHIATATSQLVLGLLAAEGTATHMFAGELGINRRLGQASLIAVGAIGGAQLGARLAPRLPGEVLLRVLGTALLLVALRLGWVFLSG